MMELLHASPQCVLPSPFYSDAIRALTLEHGYWTSEAKTVRITSSDGRTHALQRYWADWTRPRPESYRCAGRGSSVLSRLCCGR